MGPPDCPRHAGLVLHFPAAPIAAYVHIGPGILLLAVLSRKAVLCRNGSGRERALNDRVASRLHFFTGYEGSPSWNRRLSSSTSASRSLGSARLTSRATLPESHSLMKPICACP